MPGYRVDIPSVNMIYVFILLLQKNYRFCFFPYAATSFVQKICWQKHGDGECWCHMIIPLSCLTIAATLSTITRKIAMLLLKLLAATWLMWLKL